MRRERGREHLLRLHTFPAWWFGHLATHRRVVSSYCITIVYSSLLLACCVPAPITPRAIRGSFVDPQTYIWMRLHILLLCTQLTLHIHTPPAYTSWKGIVRSDEAWPARVYDVKTYNVQCARTHSSLMYHHRRDSNSSFYVVLVFLFSFCRRV